MHLVSVRLTPGRGRCHLTSARFYFYAGRLNSVPGRFRFEPDRVDFAVKWIRIEVNSDKCCTIWHDPRASLYTLEYDDGLARAFVS
jgi:hypothetical protein